MEEFPIIARLREKMTFDERALFFAAKMKHSFDPLVILLSLTFISQITSGNGIQGWIFGRPLS